MTTEANFTNSKWDEDQQNCVAVVASGEVYQLRDGQLGIAERLNAGIAGAATNFRKKGIAEFAKVASLVCLRGARAYFDRANNVVTPLKPANGFYAGRFAQLLTSTSATRVVVDINHDPKYDFDLNADAWTSALAGTAAAGGFDFPRRQGSHRFAITATSEAQKVDALGDIALVLANNPIVEATVNVIDGDAAGALDVNIGIASGTHATDADSITKYLFLHLDGNSTAIRFQSKDGTTTVASADSTKVYVAGTAFLVQFDLSDLANVKIYVNGVRVLSGTVFDISAWGVTAAYPLVHLEKTSSTDTGNVKVDLRIWNAEQ